MRTDANTLQDVSVSLQPVSLKHREIQLQTGCIEMLSLAFPVYTVTCARKMCEGFDLRAETREAQPFSVIRQPDSLQRVKSY
jgi:hypothetical protein